MAIFLRKEWFGGIIGETHSYNLKIVNDYTFKMIEENVKKTQFDTTVLKLFEKSGLDYLNESIFIFNRVDKTHKSNKILTAPIIFWIELLSNCTNNCRHCFAGRLTNDSINIYLLKKILKDLRKIGVYKITLTGGEPL